MRILGIIPARAGSKGVPGKNRKVLGQKPLIAYTIEQAKASVLLASILVSTDDATIQKLAVESDTAAPFLRPEGLANDTATSISVVQHAVDFLERQGDFFDAVCLLQPTSPFRAKGFIDQAITTFIDSGADALVSVLPVPQELNPHWVFEPDRSGYLKIATGEPEIISRRQALPPAFFRDGAVYLTKTEWIKKGSFYGQKLAYLESDPQLYVNIDTPEDWLAAEHKLPQIIHLI